MNTFLAAEQGSHEIRNDLNNLNAQQKRQNSSEQEKTDELFNKKNKTDKNIDKGRTFEVCIHIFYITHV